MITSKERAKLRALANSIETILQIGKGGITDNLIKQVDEALTARQLIKLRVLDSSLYTAREAADELTAQTGCEPIQVIGTRLVLYRPDPKNPLI